jgi:hypothetical protein
VDGRGRHDPVPQVQDGPGARGRIGGDDNGLVDALQPLDLLIKLSDARSRFGSQRAAERQRLLSSRDRPSFAAVATAGMCQKRL